MSMLWFIAMRRALSKEDRDHQDGDPLSLSELAAARRRIIELPEAGAPTWPAHVAMGVVMCARHTGELGAGSASVRQVMSQAPVVTEWASRTMV